MKTIILCGGFGTRISEYTKTVPKPMIKIGQKPILMHIIDTDNSSPVFVSKLSFQSRSLSPRRRPPMASIAALLLLD